MQKVKFNFDSVTNWDRPNNVIAEEFGCDERTVRNARRVRGLPFAPRKATEPSWVQQALGNVDNPMWQELSDYRIAMVIGCSKSSVQVYRKKHIK